MYVILVYDCGQKRVIQRLRDDQLNSVHVFHLLTFSW